jgi:hypothetical protein
VFFTQLFDKFVIYKTVFFQVFGIKIEGALCAVLIKYSRQTLVVNSPVVVAKGYALSFAVWK